MQLPHQVDDLRHPVAERRQRFLQFANAQIRGQAGRRPAAARWCAQHRRPLHRCRRMSGSVFLPGNRAELPDSAWKSKASSMPVHRGLSRAALASAPERTKSARRMSDSLTMSRNSSRALELVLHRVPCA
jgi:hypothetical protein